MGREVRASTRWVYPSYATATATAGGNDDDRPRISQIQANQVIQVTRLKLFD
jgi:hypothetical protein